MALSGSLPQINFGVQGVTQGVRHMFDLYDLNPTPHYYAEIVEVETCGVAIYSPVGEFLRTNSYCHLYGAQGLGQRQAFF
ncbi:hypothetical protein TNCV_4271551 [Trichonephila clavipes]|nr:hypothetical protein TNCV_4271551 [Trichonephila clavipes]